MNRKCSKTNDNMYWYYRNEAAKTNPLLESRERAAEGIGISYESLRNYEEGITTNIPPRIILKMSMVYNAPELRSYYCSNICPIGVKDALQVDTKHLMLDRLTLRLLNSFSTITETKDMLVNIAADGIIDDNEQEDLECILKRLDDIAAHAQALRMWAEKNLK